MNSMNRTISLVYTWHTVCSCVPSDGAQDIAVKDSGVRMNAQHIIHRFIATNQALLLLLLLQQQFVLPSFLLDELFVEQFRRDGIGLFDFLVEIFLQNKKKHQQNINRSVLLASMVFTQRYLLFGAIHPHNCAPIHGQPPTSNQERRTGKE